MKKLSYAFFDIETSFGLFYTFANNMYEAKLSREHTPIKLLTVSVKELGKKPKSYAVIDYPDYKSFVADVREKVFVKYDVLIAHNGKRFDLRMCNTFFAEVGLPKVDKFPANMIDTKNEAKREWALPSHSLSYLLNHFKLGAKINTGGESLWYECMEFLPNGKPKNPKAWKKMRHYCDGDVIGGEALYQFMRKGGWIKRLVVERLCYGKDGCIRCGGHNIQFRGEKPYKEGVYEMVWCKDCNKHQPYHFLRPW